MSVKDIESIYSSEGEIKMTMDIKKIFKVLKAPAGAMTADVAILGLKLVFGDTLGGLLGTGLKEFLKQNKDKSEEELKQIEVSEEIQKEIQKEIKKQLDRCMEEQKHPLYMNGIVLFFDEVISEEDGEELKTYVNACYKGDMEPEDAEHWNIVKEFFSNYGCDDCDTYEDTFYINFDPTKINEYLYAEDRVCKMADALNNLREANMKYDVNAITSYAIF